MYVYLLQSTQDHKQRYIGITANLKSRVREHNLGESKHTSKYKPWKLKVAVWFEDKDKAHKFERYLKHGSGAAFTKRHFV